MWGASTPLVIAGRKIILAHGTPAPNWSVATLFFLLLLAVALQAGNIVGWPYTPGPFAYVLGLIIGLTSSGSIFVYLVLIRPDADVPGR